jgi:cyclopropane-fatty-acyl-phospholipid synthase
MLSSGRQAQGSGAENRRPLGRRDFGTGAFVAHAAQRESDGASQAQHVYEVERGLVRRFLRALGDPPIEIVLWDGQAIGSGVGPPVARVHLRDRRALLKLIVHPELNFGDGYVAGRIEVEGDLLRMLEAVYRASAKAGAPGPVRRRAALWLRRTRANTLAGSRNNIYHHYDIGDDFYRLWLDREMVYTCGYFPDAETTLDAAQLAKMEHVCRKLWLNPGETVVEAGCGWGGLALYMARHFGVTVKAFNVSKEQIKHAQARARQEGMQSRITFIEDDYRNIAGRYDVFVSVGMLEHVGPEHYDELGDVVDRCLGPDGRGLIHSIGRDSPGIMNAWIERRIFPGAYPPSLREMLTMLEPRQFSVLDVENLRLHYAQTLRHWLARFDAAAERVAAMFDEPFVRAWRLYLTGSIAAFTMGSLQLFQVLFARAGMNDIPATREHLYR